MFLVPFVEIMVVGEILALTERVLLSPRWNIIISLCYDAFFHFDN